MEHEDLTVDIISSLRRVPVLEQLSEELLQKVAALCMMQNVERGERLIAEGEQADNFFIVLQGRFVVFAGTKAIAEVAAGEPIGEMAFFSGGRRGASVVAARQSKVLVLTRTAYNSLIKDMPELASSIITALAKRVNAANPKLPDLHPRAGATVGLFPASNGKIDPAFIDKLSAEISQVSDWRVVRQQDAPPADQISDWMVQQEVAGQKLLLVCENIDTQKGWAKQISDVSEINIIVVDTETQSPEQSPPSELEEHIFASSLRPNTHLVLLRDTASSPIRNSSRWLQSRFVGLHHHVALDRQEDIARLARFIKGEAVGLVFCGGGAFGAAHLGMVKALQEHGYVFDMLGGTSMGAAIAGAFAMGLPPERVMDICDELFVKSRAMKRLTAPIHSVIEHRYFDEQLKKHYENYEVEDLPLNFYSVATSLTYNDLSVLRRGPLWKAVRASSAIPGVFPPMVGDDGEVLVDGALIDNAPLETMRSLKPGPNIVLNFLKTPEWRVRTDYDKLPGRSGALRKLLLGKGVRFPSMFSVLSRCMVVNAERRISMTDPGRDIFLETANLKGMGFLDWTKGRLQFEVAYKAMSEALDTASRSDAHESTDILKLAAEGLSNGRSTMWGKK